MMLIHEKRNMDVMYHTGILHISMTDTRLRDVVIFVSRGIVYHQPVPPMNNMCALLSKFASPKLPAVFATLIKHVDYGSFQGATSAATLWNVRDT